MQCRFCQFDNRQGIRYCEECGRELSVECSACGACVPAGRKFCGSCGATLTPSQATPDRPGRPSVPRSDGGAERRQLTVMFCDLVGYTAMSRRLDPEDSRDILRTYQAACSERIEQFGGCVARFMGDGIMAYFGYPHAHEDDAKRAIHAGLGIVEAVRSLAAGAGGGKVDDLAVRVGIATGIVVVGDLIGAGASEEWAVTGDTPNLAARLQSVADPNSVVLAQGTRSLAGEQFEYADFGCHDLKGIEEPLQVWRATGSKPAQSRFEAARRGAPAPLVGREEELAALGACWQQVKSGLGQLALICGEPGIGKSRLAREFQARIAGETPSTLHYQCSPYHVNSAFYPVVTHLERAAGFGSGEDAAGKLEKLEALLHRVGEAGERALCLVAALLSIPAGERLPPLAVDPPRQKEETFDLLLGYVERLSARGPVVCVFEDLHWVDASTREYIDRLVRRMDDLPVLLLVTFRPPFEIPDQSHWNELPNASPIVLERVDRITSKAIVDSITAGKALPEEILTQILDKTDGIPLFVEELTRTVLESEILSEEADRYSSTDLFPALGIPATLQDSLMARLDRSSSGKKVAQVAAVIGRVFSRNLLEAVVSVDHTTLTTVLSRLQDAGIIYRQSSSANGDYEFKHALLRDAAYQSLLKSVRRTYHERIAHALEQRLPDTAATQPELLAHHYIHASCIEPAVSWLQRAGQRAIERSANIEALGHLDKALRLLPSVDATRRSHQELALQLARGIALTAAEGFGAPAVRQTYQRARELCVETGDEAQMFPVVLGLWRVSMSRSEFPQARELAAQLFETARRLGRPELLLMAHGTIGITLLYLGELEDAGLELEEAIARYDPDLHHQMAAKAGQDPGVACMILSALGMWLRGLPEQARVRQDETLSLARRLSHPFSLAYALRVACTIAYCARDAGAVREFAGELRALAVEKGFEQMLVAARIFEGSSVAGAEIDQAVVDVIAGGIAEYERKHVGLNRPLFQGILASRYSALGETQSALDTLDEALRLVATTRECWYEAELNRLKGELLLEVSDPREDDAEAQFRRAISVARGQGAVSLELRSACSLARMWQQRNQRGRVREELAHVYSRFEGARDTADLVEARALLDGTG